MFRALAPIPPFVSEPDGDVGPMAMAKPMAEFSPEFSISGGDEGEEEMRVPLVILGDAA